MRPLPIAGLKRGATSRRLPRHRERPDAPRIRHRPPRFYAAVVAGDRGSWLALRGRVTFRGPDAALQILREDRPSYR